MSYDLNGAYSIKKETTLTLIGCFVESLAQREIMYSKWRKGYWWHRASNITVIKYKKKL